MITRMSRYFPNGVFGGNSGVRYSLSSLYTLDVGQVQVGFDSTSYIALESIGEFSVCVSVPDFQLVRFEFNLTVISVDGSASEL